MQYKKSVGLGLILSGIILVVSEQITITGGVVGVSSDAVSRVAIFVGLGLLIGGVGLIFMARRVKGLGKIANEADALIKQGKILDRPRELISLAQRMGYTVKGGGKHPVHVYKEGKLIGPIPTHPRINRNTARGIMVRYRDNYSS